MPKPEGTRGTDPWNFETFKENFRAQYEDVGVKERALKELSKLNHPISQKVPDYISKFRVLIAEAEIAEETLIVHYFQQGLHERIWEDIRRVHVPSPKTWKRWEELAMEFYNERVDRWGPGATPTRQGGFPTNRGFRPNPFRMQRGIRRTNLPAPGTRVATRMSEAERD